MAEKEKGKITITETDEGLRIEVTGKSFKDALSCCGVPITVACKSESQADCCVDVSEKK